MPTYHVGRLARRRCRRCRLRPQPCRLLPAQGLGQGCAAGLDHDGQTVGLPVGQHLLMRLRDPATREAMVRAYTTISRGTARGRVDVLVKIYRDTPRRKGWRMTQALDAIPLGRSVDFKGPLGKFEYLGRGLCAVSGSRRRVRRFNMICGGSGVTPMLRVLRALTDDADDATEAVVIDGNRVDDILFRTQLDAMVASSQPRCRLLHTLTQPSPAWTGRRGRIDKAVAEAEIGRCCRAGDDMVLFCGPEPMERSVHELLLGLGWSDDDILFF